MFNYTSFVDQLQDARAQQDLQSRKNVAAQKKATETVTELEGRLRAHERARVKEGVTTADELKRVADLRRDTQDLAQCRREV